MIAIRRARPSDAGAIGAVHAEVWRNTYAGVLPSQYLSGLSPFRLGQGYERGILDRREGHAVFVAVASGSDLTPGPMGVEAQVVGFVSGGRARRNAIAAGEVETIYLLEDWRDRAVGRRLMRAMGAHLRAVGCGSAMVWVLKDNPSRWFYERLGGRPAAREMTRFAGQNVEQMAYAWDPIEALLTATAPAPER